MPYCSSFPGGTHIADGQPLAARVSGCGGFSSNAAAATGEGCISAPTGAAWHLTNANLQVC